jgi:hypothetical protein
MRGSSYAAWHSMKIPGPPHIRLLVSAVAACAAALCPTLALAYPTSVVFAPTGDVKGPGDVGALFYYAAYVKPSFGTGPTWVGADIGLLPKMAYGDSGLSFGGLEVGVDAIATDIAGTDGAFIKPVFNFKLQLLTESGWIPHFSIGAMEVSPFRIERSMNLVYGSFTKTLMSSSGTSYGRVTLGLGGALNNPAGDPYKDVAPVFYATAPFSGGSRLLMLAGYESPAFGPFSIGLDHVGGYSEVSSTNLALNMTPFEGGTLAIGGFVGSDPNAFYGGAFAYLVLNFNAIKTFGQKEEPAPAAPPPAP